MDRTTIRTLVYSSFDQIGQPEPFTDGNGNGAHDAGEAFNDVNGNGEWDDDMGAAGLGGPGDIVLYDIEYETGAVTRFFEPIFGRDRAPRGGRRAQRAVLSDAAVHRAAGHGFRRDRAGIAAVEFALVLPVMILFSLGIAEVGRFALLNLKLQHAATTMADLAVARRGAEPRRGAEHVQRHGPRRPPVRPRRTTAW